MTARLKRKTEIIRCEIDEIELNGDYGGLIPSVQATCPRCGHTTESYGTGEPSIKRCLVLLHEECPEGANNFYTAPEYVEFGPDI